MFSSVEAKGRAATAARWFKTAEEYLKRLDLQALVTSAQPPEVEEPRLDSVLSVANGRLQQSLSWGAASAVPADQFLHLGSLIRVVEETANVEDALRRDATRAGNTIRRAEASKVVNDMPLERLKEVTRDRLTLTPLQRLGWKTVGRVMQSEEFLASIPGIGDLSAARIAGAARTLWQTTFEEMPVRIDVSRRQPETTKLLRCLGKWLAFRDSAKTLSKDRILARQLKPLANASSVASLLLLGANSHQDLKAAVSAVHELMKRAESIDPSRETGGDPWDGFLRRPADYFALLAELGFITENEEKVHGELPQEIVTAVRALELRGDHLHVSLRGYQSFAARFALVQKRVLIGDEMGLGKTIEALAVLAHLKATGKTHFLVLCPAAVVTNWMREVESKTTLAAHRLHGYERDTAARNWRRRGGVAITTYESLGWFTRLTPAVSVDCVISDEAHALKNPAAQRSRRSAEILAKSRHAVLMTGTPLENRVEEFRQLISYLRPDLTSQVPDFAPRRFRKQVAPAYLRRNTTDVLTELPERIDVDEWVAPSASDLATYRTAVASGNFMAMRQAAMQGPESSKVERLLELVEEAEDNGHKVIVFSYFRQVLGTLSQLIPGKVFGPLTGSVTAAARQIMVDDFTRARGGAVLLSQVVAGGVGLNIQAASIVILCEPQLKPTMEEQAIARAHRMGQVRTVQVHRLLSEEGVDARIVELLAKKRALFDEFARHSETAASAPEAYDLSEAELARQIVDEERTRLLT